MIWVFIGFSLLFIVVSFSLTENNAQYLLAGYNTISEKERKKVDIKSYIPFIRNFHLFLGFSFFVIGILLLYFISESAAGIFLAGYPILAYIYFIWKSKDSFKGISSKTYKIGAIFLAVVLVAVLVLMYLGLKEDRLLVKKTGIEIQGFYGEEQSSSEIQRIELVNELPEITFKTNGFALGNTYKGYFKTKEGGVVKLILNSMEGPYILIERESDNRVYYSSRDLNEPELYQEARKVLRD